MSKLTRSTVPASSPIREPLTPHVEPIVGQADQPDHRTPVLPDSRSNGVPESVSTEVRESQTPVLPESVTPGGGGPKWAGLERKEARLRADQVEALAALRRRVSAQRTNRSEIITDNTLIRIAVDLLLSQGERLTGDTETELTHSALQPTVGRPRRRNSQSPAVPDSGTP
ncbi:hypothetical protein LUR56_39260 [Streptomyces sp. MT29]|nr:hypothetical protein [Streptomyces sp. MT29]